MGTAVENRLIELWETPKTWLGVLGTVDHKELGKRYVITALIFLLIGGVEALIMRLQLAAPNNRILPPEMYDQIFTLHGMTMIFWYASPILSGIGIYIVPLMAGARDLAFPRLNSFTYYAFLFSGILLYISPCIGQAPHGGWFANVPYTNVPFSPNHGMDFFNCALVLLTIATTGGAINLVVTILRLRAPGMTVSRMPVFFYSTLTVSVVTLFAMPSLTAANIMLELDRQWNTNFFVVSHGGSALLWQQLFWFFGHPWVYIVFLPATGIISEIIPVFSRRPLVGYIYIVVSTVLTGLVGFGVWMHHMFATGAGQLAMSMFSAASMTISIFTIVQVVAWIITIWRGRVVMKAAMYYAVGFIILIIIGGLDGVVTAVMPLDWQITGTYWVVSHLHYVLVGANMFPVFAAIYYWYPKVTGRMLNETLGKLSFWIMFCGFNVAFFTMHILGVEGMPRRIYTYVYAPHWGSLNMLITWGAWVLGFGILLTAINIFWSKRHGAIAGKNPWHAGTLEWSSDSPPKPYGTVHLPTVVSRQPLWDEHDEEEDPHGERILDQGRLTFATTWLDAEPYALVRMPKETIKPLLAAFGFFVIAGCVVFKIMWGVLPAVIFTLIVMALWQRPNPESEKS